MSLLRRLLAGLASTIERTLRRLSLRTQVAILLAAAMLPVGIFAIAQGVSVYRETKELRREALTLGAVEASRAEQAAILEAFGMLGALESQLVLDASPDQCREVLSSFVEHEPTVPFIGFISIDGIMNCSQPVVPPRDFSDQLGFQTFLESPRRSVTAQERGEISGQEVIVINQPIYRDGMLAGALSMSISSRYLEWVAKSKDLPVGSRFAIVTSSGIGVAQGQGGTDFDWLPSASELRSILPETGQFRELTARGGGERVYAIIPLFKRDIFTIASWPEAVGAEWLGWRKIITIILPILMWGLAIVVAYFAVDQLALRHIVYLDRLLKAYGRSGRSLRARRTRNAPSEIAQLGTSFDAMAVGIETREKALIENVEEKEALLREVNHRVKNNLQLISSLMNFQIRDASGDRERAGLERLQERIEGLALVHRKIYESENAAAVRLDLLIEEIAGKLRDGSAREHSSIKLTTDLDPVTATPEVAVPLVLFATETIVNTFKHALSHVDEGRLDILFKEQGENLRLVVSNTLAQTDPERQTSRRRGIGQLLLEGFARQLRGKLTVNGTDNRYEIKLVIPKPAERVSVA